MGLPLRAGMGIPETSKPGSPWRGGAASQILPSPLADPPQIALF